VPAYRVVCGRPAAPSAEAARCASCQQSLQHSASITVSSGCSTVPATVHVSGSAWAQPGLPVTRSGWLSVQQPARTHTQAPVSEQVATAAGRQHAPASPQKDPSRMLRTSVSKASRHTHLHEEPPAAHSTLWCWQAKQWEERPYTGGTRSLHLLVSPLQRGLQPVHAM
jgi:hypothetical protein